MACSFDFPLGRVGVVRSGGEARLAFAAGDDWMGCDRAALLCALLLRYGGVIVGVSWRVDNGTDGLELGAEIRRAGEGIWVARSKGHVE